MIRTIADIYASEEIKPEHLAEAFNTVVWIENARERKKFPSSIRVIPQLLSDH